MEDVREGLANIIIEQQCHLSCSILEEDNEAVIYKLVDQVLSYLRELIVVLVSELGEAKKCG